MVAPAALRSTSSRVSRRLPHGWPDALKQLLLWGMADMLYEGVRGLVVGHGDVALANAHTLVSMEQTLGIFWEAHVQSWIVGHHALTVAANWAYLNIQFTANAAFLGAIYIFRNEIFYFVRNMFFVSMAIALVVHLAIPVAPPRMLPAFGFVDTIHQVAHINQDKGAISVFVNPYAAVPSMHMCFALLVGVVGFRLASRRWLRALALVYPVFVLSTIVVTANHFFLDAVAGAATALLAAAVASQVMARARPGVWAWAAGSLPAASPAYGTTSSSSRRST